MSTTTTHTQTATTDDFLRRFPDVRVNLVTTSPPPKADTDLEGYDEEQIRLMDEVCIVLDHDDIPIGTASKKVCQWLNCPSTAAQDAYLRDHRPSDGKHQQRFVTSGLFGVSVRLPKPLAIAATGDGKNHLPGYVDEYVLLTSFGHSRRDRV